MTALRVVPFERPAHGVVPDGAAAVGGLVGEVVDEVETVLEFGIDLLHFHAEGHDRFVGRTSGFKVDGRCVDLNRIGEGFALSIEETGVGHFDLVEMVRIETPYRNAAVREEFRARNLVGDLVAVQFRHDRDGRIGERVASVADHGGERRDFIRIHDDFADMLSLHFEVGVRARSAADRHRGGRQHGEAERKIFDAEIHDE
jgi:hypothetical protein